MTGRGLNLTPNRTLLPNQQVIKFLSAPKSLIKLCGVYILFRSVEDAEIEASKQTISMLKPQVKKLKNTKGLLIHWITSKDPTMWLLTWVAEWLASWRLSKLEKFFKFSIFFFDFTVLILMPNWQWKLRKKSDKFTYRIPRNLVQVHRIPTNLVQVQDLF